jgi:hypothetical protein
VVLRPGVEVLRQGCESKIVGGLNVAFFPAHSLDNFSKFKIITKIYLEKNEIENFEVN